MSDTSNLRILHICFGKEGGAERFFVNLVQAFERRGGIDQRFIIRPNRTWRRHIVEIGPTIENDYNYLSLSRWWLRAEYRRIIRNWKPDVVFSWAPRAGRLQQSHPKGPLKIVRLGDFPLHLKHFQNCDEIVANTPAITERVKELGWNRPATTITNFARPVTPSAISRADHNTPEDVFLIAAAGRFVPRKGMDTALRMFARMENAMLWLLGDGPERDALEGLAKQLGIFHKVRFLGWIDEPVHFFAAADAVVFPSRHEPLGNVILDAWQAKKPVIATRSEGPGWFMRHDVDGLLTDIDDVDALAKAMTDVQGDTDLRERLGNGGHRRLKSFFAEDTIVNQYLSLFSDRLGCKL